jgi:hypothetical protein
MSRRCALSLNDERLLSGCPSIEEGLNSEGMRRRSRRLYHAGLRCPESGRELGSSSQEDLGNFGRAYALGFAHGVVDLHFP